MTEHELSVVRDAIDRGMEIGVPGISENMRKAIVGAMILRIYHGLLISAPPTNTKVLDVRPSDVVVKHDHIS